MRWYWIDRFTHFVSQKRAQAVKAVSLAEEHLHDHFRYHPIMPGSLIIEGLAQVGGLLACEATGYKAKVVLAKIPRMLFRNTEIVPGDLLTYQAFLDSLRDDGAVASVFAYRGNELMAEGEFVFAHLTDLAHKNTTLFADGDLLEMMRIFKAYEIGTAVDGSKLLDPEEQRAE